ncbi:MAG: YkgJ family cysteine cluster protein [Polyangiaceae bacterium]|nr:YkgJ family cysteine cluster protein [Polyangiaceae bacterium]
MSGPSTGGAGPGFGRVLHGVASAVPRLVRALPTGYRGAVPVASGCPAPPPPPIYGGEDAGPRPETRAQVAAALLRGIDPLVVVDHVARGVDALTERLLTVELADRPKPACSRGCSYCCHQRVEVTAPEVFWLARALTGRDDVLPRIGDRAARLRGLDGRSHHLLQIACALLDDRGECSAYPKRPVMCRRAHSMDAGVCLAVHARPDVDHRVPYDLALDWHVSALVLGFLEGLAVAGFGPHLYELHAALAFALADPETERRWRAGEDPLAIARTRDAADLPSLLGGRPSPGERADHSAG